MAWDKRIKAFRSGNSRKVIWLHSASLGEFEQGKPILEAFKKHYPDWSIVVTFFSPSGYKVKKNDPIADHIDYLPLDLPGNARKFVHTLQPNLAVFIKYEFWYFFLRALERQKTPTYLVSGIFRENQALFKLNALYGKKVLPYFDYFFLQNQDSAELLGKIGLTNHLVTGDTRFDRVWQNLEKRKALVEIENFKQDKRLLVVGSAWQEDLDVILPWFEQSSDWKLLIAPHKISEAQINKWKASFKRTAGCWSDKENLDFALVEILIVDTIGLLQSIYFYADVVFVGGAYGAGLHNTLEAAVFGKPMVFGNLNYQKFQEANELIELAAAYPIENTAQLSKRLTFWEDKKNYQIASKVAFEYIETNKGATEKIMTHLQSSISTQTQ